MSLSVYPTTAIVALSSRFLPRYDDGRLDHADLSIMSSPHIWNLVEFSRIKVLLSLVWCIVWMPPSVYPVMQSWHPLISFFLGMMLGAWSTPICLSFPVPIDGIYSNFPE